MKFQNQVFSKNQSRKLFFICGKIYLPPYGLIVKKFNKFYYECNFQFAKHNKNLFKKYLRAICFRYFNPLKKFHVYKNSQHVLPSGIFTCILNVGHVSGVSPRRDSYESFQFILFTGLMMARIIINVDWTYLLTVSDDLPKFT